MVENVSAFFAEYPQLVYVLRLILAGVCGGVIGVERTLRQKDAGFRTHIIVAVGAALLIIVSKYGFFDMMKIAGVKLDPSRVASTIITGFSFLGAGMIFVKGVNIKGLTTAAGILVTAAIGMSIGAGMYVVGLSSVALLLLVQIVFHKFLIGFDKVLANDNINPCFIQIDNVSDSVNDMKKYLEDNGVHISDSSVEVSDDNSLLTIRLNVVLQKNVDLDETLNKLRSVNPTVRQAIAL